MIASTKGVRPGEVERVPRPGSAPTDPKITARHLGQRALIYVRQSSVLQVQRHPESGRRQYALTERAQQLGWAADQITVIDEDQGKSGAGSAAAHEREGFARLVSAVGLGEVGIVLALEVSRLARNSAEWYRLLELAALAGTLIGDEDAIYDPRQFNDRLLLGLRGTISEVELHCIQARLRGARLSKVRRGELALPLPVGYVRTGDGAIEFDPDQEVQGAIRTIFDQFERVGTAQGVLHFFGDHGLRLPRRLYSGPRRGSLVWVKPSYQAIHLILTNPTYAGAYAYGRRRTETASGLGPPGPRRRFALDALEVLIPDHHPAYIDWERYLANRAVLRDNTRQFASSRGAPRPGPALLTGLVSCGKCGCRMQVHYAATSPHYTCQTRKKRYGEPVCQSLTIDHVDRAVGAAFLTVIRPAAVEALLLLSEEIERDQAQVAHQWQRRLERARYEAERAARQYDLCEPENRLVARELETRWNEKLRLLTELEDEYRREQSRGLSPLSEAEKDRLRSLVTDVPVLWQAAETTPAERKRLLRCLIREVVLDRGEGAKGAGGTTTIRIGWRSGAWSELRVRRPSSSDALRTPAAVLDRIRTLAQQLPDQRIAEVLASEGLTTRMGLVWNEQRVQQLRLYHGIPTACPRLAPGVEVRGDGLISTCTAAARLGVSPGAVTHWWAWGFLQGEQRRKDSPIWIRLTAEDIPRLDGTLAAQGHGRWTLREAERALGLSREQIGECARRGEVVGYRARIADHWEWRIGLADDSPSAGEHTS